MIKMNAEKKWKDLSMENHFCDSLLNLRIYFVVGTFSLEHGLEPKAVFIKKKKCAELLDI